MTQLRYISGNLLLYDNNTTWNGFSFENYLPVIIAENDKGVEWLGPVTDNGGFGFSLPDGDYTFTVEQDELNATSLADHSITENASNTLLS